MRQLHPPPRPAAGGDDADIDIVERYAADARPAPPGRPWIAVNMVTSIDGATAVNGVSGSLGGPTDRRLFLALRSGADVILVGAGTVRAEDYGQPRVSDAGVADRVARGQAPLPRLAITSGSLALDPTSRYLAEAAQGTGERPIIYTVTVAPADRRAALAEVAELVDAGTERLDLAAVAADLGRRGVQLVVCEGGGTLNGELVAADLIDELCLTVAPVLASGPSGRAALGPAPAVPHRFTLDRLIDDDSVLFFRYLRAR